MGRHSSGEEGEFSKEQLDKLWEEMVEAEDEAGADPEDG